MSKPSNKRPRKNNFSEAEALFLSDKYEEFKSIIDAKHKDANTNRKKREAWDDILRQHQSRFAVERSLTNLKEKLSKLKTEGREALLSQKKAKTATGGGKPPKDPSPAAQKIIDLCADTPGFKGLDGMESGGLSKKSKEEETDEETSMARDDYLGE